MRVDDHALTGLQGLASDYASIMMDAEELSDLGLAILNSERDGRVVCAEIGTFVGQTATFALEVCRANGVDLKWLAIDPHGFFQGADEANPQGNLEELCRRISLSGGVDHILPLVCTSDRAASMLLPDFDLVVVDGFHSEEQASSDLRCYYPLLRRGGCLFLDDYVPAYPGVMAAWDAFSQAHQPKIIVQTWYVWAQKP